MSPAENIPSPRRPGRTTSEQLDPKVLAASRREAMRRRASRIRRSVTGLALALFTAAFVAIYVQLASGHDPALSAKRQATTTSTSAASTATSGGESSSGSTSTGEEASGESSESSSSTGEATSSESTSAGSEESSESPSAVTTSQS
jgi:hypothetical protein